MKSLFATLVTISTCIVFFQAGSVEGWGENYQVIIKNDLGTDELPLGLQCHSKNTDVGKHVLRVGQVFKFHFGMNIFGTTRFWCSFMWEGAKADFDVFSSRLADKYCGEKMGSACFWSVRRDGFYLGHTDNPANATLINHWSK